MYSQFAAWRTIACNFPISIPASVLTFPGDNKPAHCAARHHSPHDSGLATIPSPGNTARESGCAVAADGKQNCEVIFGQPLSAVIGSLRPDQVRSTLYPSLAQLLSVRL